MVRKREDAFKIALDTLRRELRAGTHPAGARLTATEIAERLRLSQTPVREALSRLAGEGLLQDRRGQGYFVPDLSDHDLVSLFELTGAVLRIACRRDAPPLPLAEVERLAAPGLASGDPPQLTLASERLLRAFAAGLSGALARHLGRLQDQLASVRAGEPLVLDGLAEELRDLSDALVAGSAPDCETRLAAFFARRIEAVPALSRLRGGATDIESI